MAEVRRNNNREHRYRRCRVEKQADSEQPAEILSNTLFVRNIALETSVDTIRSEFEIFGLIRDIYLPTDFSTGVPKGYGFIKYQYAEDAEVAKEYLNHRVLDGQEISIEYSSDSNRKKPQQMALINSRKRETELEMTKKVMNRGLLLNSPSVSPRSSDRKGQRINRFVSSLICQQTIDHRAPSPDTGGSCLMYKLSSDY